MHLSAKKSLVVIGGGTGTYTLLRGLKVHADNLNITAIVTMADSGGSTGRLRDEFGQLPVGDMRMALCALSAEIDTHADILRELFLYRFAKGDGLAGHNFGNLLLTALTEIVGDTSVAIETAGKILQVRGTVLPITTDNVQLVATYNTGETVVGEHRIDEPDSSKHFNRIIDLQVTPHAIINPKAYQAILEADVVLLGPGDLYTSILANCVVTGVKEAIKKSNAQIVYICNLMSRSGQTIGMHSADYVAEIEKYLERLPDWVVCNATPVDPTLVARYLKEGNHPVEQTTTPLPCQIYAGDIVSTDSFVTQAGDTIVRSLVRHDPEKLARVVLDLVDQ